MCSRGREALEVPERRRRHSTFRNAGRCSGEDGSVALAWRAAANARVTPLARPAYELFMLLLTGLSIFNAAAIAGARLAGASGPAGEVLLAMETAMTPLFVADVLCRLRIAPSRHAYLVHDFGWADVLGSVPLLRILRIVRVGQVVQAVRALGPDGLTAQLRASRAMATFLLTVFLVIAVVELASATIYYAENGASGSNIESASDAIWWSLVTITTVGYGDEYPVTPEGRVIGAFLLFAGIALFSVLTGFIAHVFIDPRGQRAHRHQANDVHGALAAARSVLAEQEQKTEALRRYLDTLERMLEREAMAQRSSRAPGSRVDSLTTPVPGPSDVADPDIG